MSWNKLISLRIAELIVKQIISKKDIVLKKNEEDLRKYIEQMIYNNLKQEQALLQEANQIMEDLQNKGHQFERHKMLPLLKAKLAKKKNFIL